jgi:hypothetical protein
MKSMGLVLAPFFENGFRDSLSVNSPICQISFFDFFSLEDRKMNNIFFLFDEEFCFPLSYGRLLN